MGASNEEVLEWCQSARVLEARAEALLASLHPGLVEKIRAAGTQAEKTRGPFQERLRAQAVALRARPVVELLADADALYWRMVGAWDRLQRRWAGRVAVRWRIEPDDALQVMRLGWYRTAVRWEPSRGRYQSAAWAWSIQELLRASEIRSGGIHFARDGGPVRRADVYSLSESVPGLDRQTLGDLLPAASEPRESERDLGRVRALVEGLPARQREVLHHRYYAGEAVPTLADVGRAMGLTRERARQLEGLALGRLRVRLSNTTGRASP